MERKEGREGGRKEEKMGGRKETNEAVGGARTS
jgi:hypothetical protein